MLTRQDAILAELVAAVRAQREAEAKLDREREVTRARIEGRNLLLH